VACEGPLGETNARWLGHPGRLDQITPESEQVNEHVSHKIKIANQLLVCHTCPWSMRM